MGFFLKIAISHHKIADHTKYAICVPQVVLLPQDSVSLS